MGYVWKTKSLLFCLRYDPLIEFWRKNHITFIFIKTMSLDLLVQMACWYHLELFWLFLSKTAQHDPNWPSRNWGRFRLWGRFGSFHFTVSQLFRDLVRRVWTTCSSSVLLLFTLYRIASRVSTKGLHVRYSWNSRARKVMRSRGPWEALCLL